MNVVIVDDDGDAHGEAVLTELAALGASAIRYNLGDVRSVPLSLREEALDLRLRGEWHRVTSRTSVWWRRSGSVDASDLDREEERLAWDEGPHILRGALMSVGVRWIDDPLDIERAELKLYQLGVAAALGIAIPATRVTNDPRIACEFESEARRLIAKPLSPGHGIVPFVDEVTIEDLELVTGLATLLQEKVRASADLRAVVVGPDVWVWRRDREQSTIDWRAEDAQGAGFRRIENRELATAALRVTTGLRLSLSIQDWLETKEGPVFLEANPQGAWLFLDEARGLVTPAVARHLAQLTIETAGEWPRAIKRFFWDLLPAKQVPENDGVVVPEFAPPTWVDEAAARAEALEVARRAHDEAKSGARSAEAKASRLVQIALALLTITLAVGASQVQFAVDRGLPWMLSLVPIVAALVCLVLAAFEALEVDRVGVYRHPTASDLARLGVHDSRAVLIAEEEAGRRLARWTSAHKHSDLMQARAWFSRGLAALLIAGFIAAISRATVENRSRPAVSSTTTAPTTTASVPTTLPSSTP